MIAKFRKLSEKMCIAKFSQCIAKIQLASAASCFASASNSASFSSFPLDISSFWVDEITENSRIKHQYEAKLAEVPKTSKTTKNNLETKSVALSGHAHVNWLNSYDQCSKNSQNLS